MIHLLSKRKREKIARYITVGGSVFWIMAGVWGVNNCFDAAKETRNQVIQKIELSSRNYAQGILIRQPATWSVPTGNEEAYQTLESTGLSRTPYVFHDQTIRAMLVSLVCILVSFFVLYAVLVIDPRRRPHWSEAKTQSSFNLKP